jgi:hypothetical protein
MSDDTELPLIDGTHVCVATEVEGAEVAAPDRRTLIECTCGWARVVRDRRSVPWAIYLHRHGAAK